MLIFIAVVVILVLIVFLGYYEKLTFLEPGQWRFLISSTILFFVLLVVFRSLLLTGGEIEGVANANVGKTFFSSAYMLPVLFYLLWYLCSTVVGNWVTGTASDFTGFGGGPNPWVSQQREWST
jgi:hypothetical protein